MRTPITKTITVRAGAKLFPFIIKAVRRTEQRTENPCVDGSIPPLAIPESPRPSGGGFLVY